MSAEWFWNRVDTSGGPDVCWPWTSGRTSAGYGSMHDPRVQKTTLSHRVALELATRAPVADECALHHCDNPICCNPAHLYWGTKADNAHDRDARGRRSPPFGRRNGGFVELHGRVFDRLTVVGYAGPAKTRRGGSLWNCRCACGASRTVVGSALLLGSTRSCGCLRADRVREAYVMKVARGDTSSGELNPAAKLSAKDVAEIRLLLRTPVTMTEIARRFLVTRASIRNIRDGRTWATSEGGGP